MKKLILLFTLSGLVFFSSCGDCMQHASGTVFDAATNLPVDSVFVQKESRPTSFGAYSDQMGNFELEEISGGLFRCPAMKVVLTKEGFETKTVKIKNGKHVSIKLKKM